MIDPGLACQEQVRRGDVRSRSREDVPNRRLYGLDYVEVEVGANQEIILHVVFLGKAPPSGIERENIRISGGRRIRDIQVTGRPHVNRGPDPALHDSMDVTVNRSGDFSAYTLQLVKLDENGHPTNEPMDGFDPRYDQVSFTFAGGCPSDLDCKVEEVCPSPPRAQPEINYLAKDYQSFRQLVLDRLALTMPDWQETHAPDLGIALIELLAYVGDYLSYYQDAVATEAYLDTARQRISVRRHARLVDYAMHEGCNSRAWVTISIGDPEAPPNSMSVELDPRQFYLVTAFAGAPENWALQESELRNVPPSSYEVFEPLVNDTSQKIRLYQAHDSIPFYTWGDCQCCLAPGATAATLTDRWVPGSSSGANDGPPGTVRALRNLKIGDVLIVEEVKGPKTGNPADADPKHRQAARLTKVKPTIDPLYHQKGYPEFGRPIVEIEWCSEDALTFPLCLSAQAPPPDCTTIEDISVARGNVILVDNGKTVIPAEPLGTVPTQSTLERCTECGPSETMTVPGQFSPSLEATPLTFSEPLPACGCASAFTAQDPRQALPQISLVSIPPAPACPDREPSPCRMLCQIPPLFTFDDLDNPESLARKLKASTDTDIQFLDALLRTDTRQSLANWDGKGAVPGDVREKLLRDLNGLLETWHPKPDLLESGPGDLDFVVEIDNGGYAHLRFGDRESGRKPDGGTAFRANYRVGNGPAGNVGADKISYLVFRQTDGDAGDLIPRNPLPATGGISQETIAEVKFFAPYGFRDVLERAITGDDYATLAQDNSRRLKERPALLAARKLTSEADAAPAVTGDDPRASIEEEPGERQTIIPDICGAPFQKLQAAKGTLRWSGSWYEASVAIDPFGAEETSPELLAEIEAYLEPYRRVGHDLEVRAAQYVPLDLALTVCVLPHYLRGHVEAALLDVFSNRVLPDGRLGFFHPDNLTFGEGVYLSAIMATAQAVPGVQNLQVTRLTRYEIGETTRTKFPPHGVLALAPFEIAQLDNDPSFPENGRLTLDIRGGR
jgi:hypothetical protein